MEESIMKALLTCDWHIGLNTDSYYIKEQGNSRLVEQKKTINMMVDYAIEHKLDEFHVSGDIFDTANPQAISEFGLYEIIEKIISNNIKIKMLVGNHDFSRNSCSALDPIKALFKNNNKVKIITEPEVSGDILWMPHCSINRAQDYCDYITSMALASKPKYLIGHHHAIGAKVGYERLLLSNGELTIKAYPESVKLAILGHIHKPQEFDVNGVQTVYVGSTQKNDISENDEQKRFLDMDFDTGKYTSIPIETCKNYGIVRINESQVEEVEWGKYKDEIMHIEISGYTGKYTREDIKKKLSIDVLIKTIKLIKEDETKIKQVKNNDYKSLDFKECVNRYYNNKELAEVANSYLERAYETV